jgi:hypothetical protein
MTQVQLIRCIRNGKIIYVYFPKIETPNPNRNRQRSRQRRSLEASANRDPDFVRPDATNNTEAGSEAETIPDTEPFSDGDLVGTAEEDEMSSSDESDLGPKSEDLTWTEDDELGPSCCEDEDEEVVRQFFETENYAEEIYKTVSVYVDSNDNCLKVCGEQDDESTLFGLDAEALPGPKFLSRPVGTATMAPPEDLLRSFVHDSQMRLEAPDPVHSSTILFNNSKPQVYTYINTVYSIGMLDIQ